MGNIIAKFPEKIFFAIKDGKNYIENNFYFSFFKRENLQSPEKRKNLQRPEKTNEGIDEIPLIVFIHGLERLFEKNSLSNPIDDFLQKLESSEDGWKKTHEKDTDYGECLIVSYNQKKGDLNQEKRDLLNVTFQLREKFVFQQSFSDKEAIGITIIFKNFDNLFPDLDNEIIQDYIITAVELPDFLPAILDTNGNNVSSIFYGEKAQIKWEQGNYKKCSISLYDELGEKTEIKNNYINIPIIDRDRRFSLEVEKDGLVKSFIIPIYRSRWERESVFNNDFFKS